MLDGFIPNSRATLMLDVVTVAMVAILPLLAMSIQLAKRGLYAQHRKMQLLLAAILGAAVLLFEIDIRIRGWRHLAQPSPFFGPILFTVLFIHLFFSITTTFLWIGTIYTAGTRFDKNPKPNAFSPKHRRLGKLAAYGMLMTSVTGWLFYYMAFVAV